MEKVILGNTGIEVTKLCFGALPIGPLQKNLSIEEGSEVISYALDNGINFIDTAQLYVTYDQIRMALEKTKIRPVIASKSTAESYEAMEEAILEALKAMGIDYIDIFHLHAPKGQSDIFDIRKGALKCLEDYKKKGVVKAIGISTHNVKAVEAAASKDNIDVVFPLLNKIGRGLLGGTVKDMEEAAALCSKNGKGVYLMKVIGGGTMIDDFDSSLEYAMNLSDNYSLAIGMISKEEVMYNVKYFNGDKNLDNIISMRNKKIIKVSQHMCVGCGKCIETCHSSAISYNQAGKADIDIEKCIQCGYCISACPGFCIRIV